MENHYYDLETFPVNTCMGQIWSIATYDSEGDQDGTDYEAELVYAPKGERAVRIPLSDFQDLTGAMRKTLEYLAERKGISSPVPSLA